MVAKPQLSRGGLCSCPEHAAPRAPRGDPTGLAGCTPQSLSALDTSFVPAREERAARTNVSRHLELNRVFLQFPEGAQAFQIAVRCTIHRPDEGPMGTNLGWSRVLTQSFSHRLTMRRRNRPSRSPTPCHRPILRRGPGGISDVIGPLYRRLARPNGVLCRWRSLRRLFPYLESESTGGQTSLGQGSLDAKGRATSFADDATAGVRGNRYNELALFTRTRRGRELHEQQG